MAPSAVSTVIEQIVRIVFLLGGSAIVLFILKGKLITAVSISVFAAFVGAIGGLAVLLLYWRKSKDEYDNLLLYDKGMQTDIRLRSMYKEILLSAAPFVFVGVANPLFQAIDTVTFNRAMSSIGLSSISETALNIFNYQTHKIIIIPVSLATGFSMALIPMITRAFIKEDHTDLATNLNQTFQVLLFITLPACIGLSVLAEPVYRLFYGTEDLLMGAEVLRLYAPVAILFPFIQLPRPSYKG